MLLFTLLVTAIISLLTGSVYYFAKLERVQVFQKRLKARAIYNTQLYALMGDSGLHLLRRIDTVSLLGGSASRSIGMYSDQGTVLYRFDMPGTQRGVDLNFANDNPMNWKDYANRLKSNGTAIPKGSTARVTAIVVKNDRIEFQLDGGGFGTFFDDSNTTVNPKTIDKSSYEKDLEKQIANTDDDDKRRAQCRSSGTKAPGGMKAGAT